MFGSGCSVAYADGSKAAWAPFASLVLEGSYEATMWAALEAAVRHNGQQGSRRVFLTLLGGGVFGNSISWIAHAMRLAFDRFRSPFYFSAPFATHNRFLSLATEMWTWMCVLLFIIDSAWRIAFRSGSFPCLADLLFKLFIRCMRPATNFLTLLTVGACDSSNSRGC